MQWLMLQQNEPDDFCIATGLQYSFDFVNYAWSHLGKSINWKVKASMKKDMMEKQVI